MTGLSQLFKTPPRPLSMGEPVEIAVSAKSSVKTKTTCTKPIKVCPSVQVEPRVRVPKPGALHNTGVKISKLPLVGKVKNLIHKKQLEKGHRDLPCPEAVVCNILALIGGLVVAVVVFRSLYLMYCKSDDV